MLTYNATGVTPTAARFARFANACNNAYSLAHWRQLQEYAITQAPRLRGFPTFLALTADTLPPPIDPQPRDRLPRPPRDDTRLPAHTRQALLQAVRQAAKDFTHPDVQRAADGFYATAQGIHRRGDTIFDHTGAPMVRMLTKDEHDQRIIMRFMELAAEELGKTDFL